VKLTLERGGALAQNEAAELAIKGTDSERIEDSCRQGETYRAA
jgi:hypothetical protein